ncbi:hypothetical protein ACFFGH_10710 [Lysobacter korlensis]|uniref:Uncharacterized protein n=1 Tax=Lysobacter korlensis TaxID=553636 RepID=A0ABV6RMX6_9GAMM
MTAAPPMTMPRHPQGQPARGQFAPHPAELAGSTSQSGDHTAITHADNDTVLAVAEQEWARK